MKTGDKCNWSMLFAAIALIAAFLGAAAAASQAELPHGYAFQALVAMQFAFIAGGVCLIVVCVYAVVTKRGACLIGFVIAVAAFPPLSFANLLISRDNLRLILPFVLLVGAFAWRPREVKRSQQSRLLMMYSVINAFAFFGIIVGVIQVAEAIGAIASGSTRHYWVQLFIFAVLFVASVFARRITTRKRAGISARRQQ